MKIVSLKDRRKKLTCITLEDESELLIDTEIVIMKDLKPGTDIGDPDVLLLESDLKRAKSRALWYLSRADHTRKNLTEKLISAGFNPKATTEAVERMEELGLIDDEKYARRLAEALNSGGHSEKEIFYKLLNKGINPSLAKTVLAENEADEAGKILKLLKTKYASKLEKEGGAEKVIASLARKGYAFSDIKDAIKTYNEEIKFSED